MLSMYKEAATKDDLESNNTQRQRMVLWCVLWIVQHMAKKDLSQPRNVRFRIRTKCVDNELYWSQTRESKISRDRKMKILLVPWVGKGKYKRRRNEKEASHHDTRRIHTDTDVITIAASIRATAVLSGFVLTLNGLFLCGVNNELSLGEDNFQLDRVRA